MPLPQSVSDPASDPVVTENNPSRPKWFLLFTLVAVILALGAFLFLLWRAGKLPFFNQKPQLLNSRLTLTEQQPLPSRELGEGYGYRLTCQIFQKDIKYVEEQIGDYLIHAVIPCWFYNQEGKIISVTIPLLIENPKQQTFFKLDANTFGESLTIIEGPVKISLAEAVFQFGPEEKYPSILVDIGFGASQFMSYPDERSDSAVFFLRPLAEFMNQQNAIEQFVQSDVWPADQNYLFYQYSQVRRIP